MRFIMTCMVIVGLSLLALPLIPAVNSIQDERAQIIADAANNVNVAVPPPLADDAPALLAQETDPAALADIAPAAGDEFFAPGDSFTGGFTNEAPAALSDPFETDPFATAPAAQTE